HSTMSVPMPTMFIRHLLHYSFSVLRSSLFLQPASNEERRMGNQELFFARFLAVVKDFPKIADSSPASESNPSIREGFTNCVLCTIFSQEQASLISFQETASLWIKSAKLCPPRASS